MFNLVTRRPATWVANDTRRMDRLFNDVFSAFPFPDLVSREADATSAWIPAVDIIEGQDGLTLVADLPGVRPEQVKVSVEQGILTIRGEKESRTDGRDGSVHRFERHYGAFQRSFQLPTSVNADKVDARLEHGVLTVTLPKAEQAKAKEIAVRTS
jgi:HSP20 family protein